MKKASKKKCEEKLRFDVRGEEPLNEINAEAKPYILSEHPPFKISTKLPKPTLSYLIAECVKFSRQGDFHLEHLKGMGWTILCCWTGDEWEYKFLGETPEIACAKLLEYLKWEKKV